MSLGVQDQPEQVKPNLYKKKLKRERTGFWMLLRGAGFVPVEEASGPL